MSKTKKVSFSNIILTSFAILLVGLLFSIFKPRTKQTIPQQTTPQQDLSTMSNFIPRQIMKQFLAAEQSEGVGARVRRSIGTLKARNFSPFLMLDHFFIAKEGAGFPDHPHRGQETVTYMLHGYVDHEDFTGSAGTIGPGDLQFMTAGKGVVHAEMPHPGTDGQIPEGMQLWVDLPEKLKHCDPRYRDLKAEEIPIAKPNDKVEVKVISGKAYGIDSVQDLAYTPLWFFDYTIKPGGSIEQEIPSDHNAILYMMEGDLKINSTLLPEHHIALFEKQGTGVSVSVDENASKAARFVLISGQEQNQPIVQHGPFVETSRERIFQAFSDYQNGQNGFERAINWESKIGKRSTY